MRAPALYALLLFVALAVAGCSVASGVSGVPFVGVPGAPPTPAAAPTPVATQTPTTMSNDPAVAAVQAVIQKANQEQQDAFSSGNPTVMKDTATSSYYDQLVQINSDMANNGVSAIKLLKTEWGQVKFTNATTAQATTFETWQTTYSDGSSDQMRQQNDYVLVQQQGVWKIQSDDNPNSGQSGAGGPTTSPSPSASTPPAVTTPASQTDTSRNWSGYAATSGKFTSVTGTWTVPQSQASNGIASSATWVGIGGVQSRDLIQAGTEDTTAGSGTVHYDAWIEMLPSPSRQIPLAIRAGDSLTVTITEQGTNQWLIDFKNNTTGETYQTTVQYASSNSSAEWIEEAPSVGRRVVPLDNFGSVQFSAGSAVENGKNVTIAQSGAQPISLAGAGGSVLATPSVLTPDGQGFNVSRSGS